MTGIETAVVAVDLGAYRVYVHRGLVLSCTCPEHTKTKRMCKHMRTVKAWLVNERASSA